MRTLISAAIFLFVSAAGVACAGQPGPDGWEVESSNRVIPGSTVENSGGRVTLYEVRSKASRDFKLFQALPVSFSFDVDTVGIDNTTELELPATLNGLTFGLDTTVPFFGVKNTFANFAVDTVLKGSNWDFSPALVRTPFHGVLAYAPNEETAFVLGVSVYPGYDVEVFPIVGLKCHPLEKLYVELLPPDPRIEYALDQNWRLFLEGRDDYDDEYAVRRDGNRTVLRYDQVSFGGGVEYIMGRALKASVSCGRIIDRRMKYKEDQSSLDIRPGYYLDFKFTLNF